LSDGGQLAANDQHVGFDMGLVDCIRDGVTLSWLRCDTAVFAGRRRGSRRPAWFRQEPLVAAATRAHQCILNSGGRCPTVTHATITAEQVGTTTPCRPSRIVDSPTSVSRTSTIYVTGWGW